MKKHLLFICILVASSFAKADNLAPFHSDGCSASPDSLLGRSLIHCCIAHDFDYWIGGTEDQKDLADKELKQCIKAVFPEAKVIGSLYEIGVELGGTPSILSRINTPFPWGWGYGWDTSHGYSDLSKKDIVRGLADLESMINNLDEQERALNETKGYAWRFRNLKISPEQFKIIKSTLDKKITSLKNLLESNQ